MKRAVTTSILSLMLIGLAGCGGIAGKWTLHEAEDENFPISNVTLNEDGTYTALSQYGDVNRESNGTYTFADGKLTFTPESGNTRVYDAVLTNMGGKLRVTSKEGDSEVVTVMKRKR